MSTETRIAFVIAFVIALIAVALLIYGVAVGPGQR